MASVEASFMAKDGVSMGEAINAATRSVHAKLNKLILLRLPLAVPPHASNPSVYITGLLHVAPIYVAFESMWQGILETAQHGTTPSSEGQAQPRFPIDGCQPGNPLLDSKSLELFPFSEDGPSLVHRPLVCERVHSFLTHLHLPGLQRSARLRADIRALTGWTESQVEEQLHAAAGSGRLAEFVAHIRRTVERHPHVLLAYAWVLYTALFSGGRFIRASLKTAGSEFWVAAPDPVRPSMLSCAERKPPSPTDADIHAESNGTETGSTLKQHHPGPDTMHGYPLQFFHFATPDDGEGLKREFKRRLSEAEGLLTSGERDAVVREAICIFDNMVLLVGQLDVACGNTAAAPADRSTLDGWANFLTPRLGGRLRDSVVVAKERNYRKERGQKPDGEGGVVEEEMTSDGAFAAEADERSEDSGDLGDKDGQQQPAGRTAEPDNADCADATSCSKTVRFESELAVPRRAQTLSTDGGSDSEFCIAAAGNGEVQKPQSLEQHSLALTNRIILLSLVPVLFALLFGRNSLFPFGG